MVDTPTRGGSGGGPGVFGTLIRLPFKMAASVADTVVNVTSSILKGMGRAVGAAIKGGVETTNTIIQTGSKVTGSLTKTGATVTRHGLNAVVAATKATGKAVVFGLKQMGSLLMAPFKAIGGLFSGLKSLIMKPLQLLSKGKDLIKNKIKTITQGEVIGMTPDGQEIRTRHGFNSIYKLIKKSHHAEFDLLRQFMNEQFEIGTKTFALLRLAHGRDVPTIKKMKLNFNKRPGMMMGETGSGLMGLLKTGFDFVKTTLGTIKSGVMTIVSIAGAVAAFFGIKKVGAKVAAKVIAKTAAAKGTTKAMAAAATAATATVGAKQAAKTGTTKSVASIASKVGVKQAAKLSGKAAGKTVLKTVLKKIPIVGFLAGMGFGIHRALKGDWTGAAMEVASGAAAIIPTVGTAASLAIDTAIIGRDLSKNKHSSQIPSSPSPQLKEVTKSNQIKPTNSNRRLAKPIAKPTQIKPTNSNKRLAKSIAEPITTHQSHTEYTGSAFRGKTPAQIEAIIAENDRQFNAMNAANMESFGLSEYKKGGPINEMLTAAALPPVHGKINEDGIVKVHGGEYVFDKQDTTIWSRILSKIEQNTAMDAERGPLILRDQVIKNQIESEVGKLKIANAGVEAGVENVASKSDNTVSAINTMAVNVVNSTSSVVNSTSNNSTSNQDSNNVIDISLDKLFNASFI